MHIDSSLHLTTNECLQVERNGVQLCCKEQGTCRVPLLKHGLHGIRKHGNKSYGSHRMNSLLQRVETELARYEHPLFRFSTQDVGTGVLLAIDLREQLGITHHYEITLQVREIENRQFSWTFQKLLYDCLHDFVVEMFDHNPQEKLRHTESN
jgi:hypothetical protein